MRGGVVPPGESERSKKKKFDPFLKIFGGGDERVNLIPKKPTLTKRRLALVSIFPLE